MGGGGPGSPLSLSLCVDFSGLTFWLDFFKSQRSWGGGYLLISLLWGGVLTKFLCSVLFG